MDHRYDGFARYENERAIDRIRQAFIEHGLTVRDKGLTEFRAQAPAAIAADDSVVFWQIGDHVAMCTYAGEDKEVLDAVGLTRPTCTTTRKVGPGSTPTTGA